MFDKIKELTSKLCKTCNNCHWLNRNLGDNQTNTTLFTNQD